MYQIAPAFPPQDPDRHMLACFGASPLGPGRSDAAQLFAELAKLIYLNSEKGHDRTRALERLLEARDWAARANVNFEE